jgi:hypothetical protein
MKVLIINMLLSLTSLFVSCQKCENEIDGSWFYINSEGEYHEVYFYNDLFTFNIEIAGEGSTFKYKSRNDTIIIYHEVSNIELDVKFMFSDCQPYALSSTGRYQLKIMPELINPWVEDSTIIVNDFVIRLYLSKFNKGVVDEIDTSYLLFRLNDDTSLLKKTLEVYKNIQ